MRSYLALAIFGLAVTGGPADADVLDLGVHNANLFSLGNFNAKGSDVEGAVLVKGNLTASSYSINRRNQDAFGSYSLVVGGSLDYSNASLNNGSYYVGGKSFLSSVGTDRDTKSVNASPADLAAMAAHARNVSASLSKLASTGSSSIAHGGMTLTGSRRAVEVFDIAGAAFSSVNYFNLNNLQSGATLIFNISGKDAIGFHQNGVGLGAFANYNVLYNFHEAASLNIQNVGVQGSILAPLATVTGSGAQINGNVIVGNWLSNVQVNADHYFKAVNVPGYAQLAPVPELSIWPMLAVGLGQIVLINVRRRDQLSEPEALAA